MMIKRCLSFICLSLAMCLGSFAAHAGERVEYVVTQAIGDYQSFGAAHVKHELTMAEWRHGSQDEHDDLASNLIALSNHFGLIGAVPMATPDWPAAVNA